MPQITNYASLVVNATDALNRTGDSETEAHVPVWIQQAEAMFSREIRYRSMLVRETLVIDEVYEDLPSGFLELKSIRFNDSPVGVPDYLSPREMEQRRAWSSELSGTPTHYTIVGTQFLFDRTPSGSPELDISMYKALPALADTPSALTSNVLLAEHPDIYLYGTLMFAETYLKNDQGLAKWTALYQNARDSLMQSDRKSERSPAPQTIRWNPARSF